MIEKNNAEGDHMVILGINLIFSYEKDGGFKSKAPHKAGQMRFIAREA